MPPTSLRSLPAWLFAIVLGSAVVSVTFDAEAQAKPAKRAAKGRAPAKASDKDKKEANGDAEPAEPAAAEATERSTTEAAPASAESGVQTAGTDVKDKKGKAKATETESEGGVKTYEFGAIEIEGRLKSPQLLYFLRRMRAEFEAGALGHRSFLRELSDTRRDAAFR